MNVVLFGASGNIGRAILQEALKRKHEVTATVRQPDKLDVVHERLRTLKVDILDPASVSAAAHGHKAAISAYGPEWGQERELLEAASSLVEGLTAAGLNRLIIVGGAGSLRTESGEMLMDTRDFPTELRPLAAAHSDAYEIYSGSELDYSYASPAAVIQSGRRTGQFRIGLDQLVVDENGNSVISVEDYAVAIIDELEEGNYSRTRFTVAY
ncbi:NAD(P)-dependent oxidoreductase [Paenibacillus wynnii]|uniref:3-beta hydroxysteroid dehydrogenase n=1 Tax=Paenibacillus wynnii TaxID=268407 RepID=A0A098MDH8_9BACL|nr:NAD(P)H-binding protein [Paenibacillus wynnii]KGE19617.1 3-beta hydroxysteroid dehydrogenase [Paenibacillus wynnii]